MSESEVPRVVYKYMTLDGLLPTIKNHSFLVRPVTDYNDPFECLPMFDRESKHQLLERFFDDSSRLKRLQGEWHLLGRELSAAQIRILLKHDPAEKARVFDAMLEQNGVEPLEFARDFQNYLATKIGFVCFSKNPIQQLMWSHYADHHRGFVVAFDLGDSHSAAKLVTYQSGRVPFRHTSTDENTFIELVRTKALDWSYEEEVRVICMEQEWTENAKGEPVGYLAFEPRQVLGIWAGVKTPQESVEAVLRELSETGQAEVPLGRAKLDQLEFRLSLG